MKKAKEPPTIKEKSRYTFIREKTKQLQKISRHRYPVPGYFMARDAVQRMEPDDPDFEESTATDSIEGGASRAEKAVLYAHRARRRNAFHRETHFEDRPPNPENSPMSPQDRMRAKVVSDRKAQVQQRSAASPHEKDMPEYGEKANKPFIKTRETVQADCKSRQRSSRYVRTAGGQLPEQRAQTVREQGRRLARNTSIQQTVHKQGHRNAMRRKLKAAVQQAARASAQSALAAGGGLILLILPLLLLFGAVGALFGGSGDLEKTPVSDEVKAYAGLIQLYAAEHGIPEYTALIAAVMMQESGGQGDDPMQASECTFNTKYPKTPGGITDRSYSISVGIQALADCLTMAGVESPEDIERISLALQGYNFGSGYISWAIRNYGGYSELNAMEFSEMMAQRMGWPSYGDPQYVQHVLRYYTINTATPQD